MKLLVALFTVFSVSVSAFAAVPESGRGRASMANQMDSRAAVSKRQLEHIAAANVDNNKPGDAQKPQEPSDKVEDVKPDMGGVPEKDMREREKAACINNNIGVGATFVWASRYSNIGNYSSMIEDVENPENNVCFVKVELKSSDSRINVSDVPTKYFIMGENITCGEWADKDALRNRILDAKKKGRTWATVGGAVGGAAVGVGAMELFGNKLIGGAVEGQAALSGTELLCSQMKVLKQEKSSKYNDIVDALTTLKQYCEETQWDEENPMPDACNPKPEDIENMRGFDYKSLLAC